jgi:hypothetical protein
VLNARPSTLCPCPSPPLQAFKASFAADVARYSVHRNDVGAQAIFDSVNNTLYAVVYDNR